MKDLQREKLKKKTESKMMWGVTAYNRWRDARMKIVDLDLGFELADLNDLKNLSKENFIESMCYFIPEVVKKTMNCTLVHHCIKCV